MRSPILYPIWLLDPAPLRDCIASVARAGFDGISFAVAPVRDPRRLDVLGEEQAADLRASLQEHGLNRTLHVLSDFLFAGVPRRSDSVVRRAEDLIERCVRALADAGLPRLIVSLDPICLPPGAKGVLNVELVAEMLRFVCSLRRRYDILPALEHWPKPGIGTPEALRQVLELAGEEEVGVLLDTGHLNLAMNASWCRHRSAADFIEALPAPVLEVHLHDNHGDADEHLLPGEGEADLAAMLAGAFETDFTGPVTLEVDLRPAGRPTPEHALAATERLCRRAANAVR